MELGLRVVRGQNWSWIDCQDVDEGLVGTVVQWDKFSQIVIVQWDSGSRCNYSIRHKNIFDLKILDNASLGIRHPLITCDSCNENNIAGMRWKCQVCCDYDLCTQCYMTGQHCIGHEFIRYQTPYDIGEKMQQRAASKKIMKGIFPLAEVKRGPDWEWNDQDGGENNVGTVLNIKGWNNKSERSVATVEWPSGFTNSYRVGHNGKVDLRCVKESQGGFYYVTHLPKLRYYKFYEKKIEEAEEFENSAMENENEKSTYKDEKNSEISCNKREDCMDVTVKDVEKEGRFLLLCRNLEDLFTSGQFCDFTIKVKEREFQIHKAILGARSPVFASMLLSDMKEKNTGMVDISDCNPDIFEDFLLYLYSAKTERISNNNVIGLYEAAEKYDVQGLKDDCIHFIKENLNMEIICDVLSLGVKYTDRSLVERATQYFISNAQKILSSVKWQKFIVENPGTANELYIKAFNAALKK